MQVINIPQVPAPPLPPEFIFQQGPPEKLIIGIVVIIGFIVAGVILGPLIKALARRIEGRPVDSGLAGEVEQLRARVAELEERVDFSERLLTQGREQTVIRGET